MTPRFSIIMAVHNGEAFIAAAIKSVLCQTLSDFELLVSDDDSKDATCEIVSKFALRDPRIRLLQRQRHGGAGGNRNHAMQHAHGEWIAFLDADDLWPEDHLAVCADAIVACPDAVIFFGDNRRFVDATADARPNTLETKGFFDPRADYVQQVIKVANGVEVVRCHPQELIKHCCLRYCPIVTGGVTLRREWMQARHLAFSEQWPVNEDFHLWMSMLEHGPGVAIRRVLFYYRENPASLTGNPVRYLEGMAQSHGAWMQRIRQRLTAAERELYRDKVAGFLHSLAWEHSRHGRVAVATWAQLRSLRLRRRPADILELGKTVLRAGYRRMVPESRPDSAIEN
jgi:glycosyltransferase involved in cell wall biosynthesis